MRIAALYDIHGNLPALESVLSAISKMEVDRIVVGGDMIPGPFPAETISTLRDLPLPVDFIQGNGERETLELLSGGTSRIPESVREGIIWCGNQLNREQLDFLDQLPTTIRLSHAEGEGIRFCHATMRNDFEIVTKNTADSIMQSVFGSKPDEVFVCGHTHMPFDRRCHGVRIINAGSVGMAFGSPDAQWLLIENGFQAQSTWYDKGTATDRVLQTRYPDATGFADQYLRQFPSETSMLEMFDSAAVNERDLDQ